MDNIRSLVKIARPLLLILAALTYSLGDAIAHYLGHAISAATFLLGLVLIVAIQAASAWLVEYFRLALVPLAPDETFLDRNRQRGGMLQAAYAGLTLGGAILISMFATHLINLPSAGLLVTILLFLMLSSLPPFQLEEKGFGEIILAIYLGTLLPAFSFLLQYGDFHRLLTFSTFPLTLLALAYLLIEDFPSYATDQKLGRQTLLTRLTWQRAIPIHHFLLLAAFLLFAISPFAGFPWGLVWPVFVVLPFAAFQIIWLQRISQGGRTLWSFMTMLAAATFALTAYLLAFTFWIR
jgi:1,4-dihydroxy-2-naphthoate polyprenyltransferase